MDLEVLLENRKDEIGRLTHFFNRIVTSLHIAMMNQSSKAIIFQTLAKVGMPFLGFIIFNSDGQGLLTADYHN
jgi:hypothetical protein